MFFYKKQVYSKILSNIKKEQYYIFVRSLLKKKKFNTQNNFIDYVFVI